VDEINFANLGHTGSMASIDSSMGSWGPNVAKGGANRSIMQQKWDCAGFRGLYMFAFEMPVL
jgi:hypothetical protein